MKVLIAYSSWHGSTAEIAERIGGVLRHDDLEVTVTPIQKAPDPAGYGAVVVGSAIHDQAWSPAATEFVRRHAPALARRPVWAFSVGMSEGLPRPVRRLAHNAQDKRVTRVLRPHLHPREHRVFSGVCLPEHLPRVSRTLLRLLGGHLGDYRDWSAIEGWARQISHQLRAPGAPITG